MLFLSFSGFSSTNEATEKIDYSRDEKILCSATIDQNFDDSSVLVIMDNVVGGINKQHELSYFGEIGATAVKDLTLLSNETLVSSGLASKDASDDKSGSTDRLPWFEVNEETFRQILKIELSVHSKENVLNVIKKLEKIEGIKYAGPNYNVYLPSESLDSSRSSSTVYPWGINITDTVAAWDITIGTHAIKVGVIDSGISEHPNLISNLVAGSNFYDNSGTGDTYGHGTQVAGIIGAVMSDNAYVQGVCKNVSLVPLKVYTTVVYDEQRKQYVINGAISDITNAITYATNNGIHIINYSIGGGEDDDYALAQAIANYPGLFVASAGNGAHNNDNHDLVYPSNYTTILPNVISVGASAVTMPGTVEEAEGIYEDSSYGANSVDLFAPGGNIQTTDTIRSGYYKTTNKSGTSAAVPFVSGAAALIMSVRPDMTPAEVKKCIMDSVDKNDVFEGKCITGGRLNVYKAVQLATQPQSFTGDVNGDGMADMIVTRRLSTGYRAIDTYLGQSDGKFDSAITTSYTQNYNYQDPVFVGDVNGDGRTDLIVHTIVGGNTSFLVYSGKVDGKFTGASLTNTSTAHDYYNTRAKFFIADVNGDGKDDFISHTRNSSGKRINITYLGEAVGTFAKLNSTASTFTSTNNHGISPVLIGDFNGDGMTDMVVPHAASGKRCLLVYKGKASAPYFSAGVKFNSSRNHDPIQWPCQYFVNDVNGDGKDDLVVHWKNANGKRNNLVYRGSSSGLTTEAVATAATSNDYVPGDQIFVGDINGDGYGDMLVQWANTYNQRNLLVYKGTSGATYGTGTSYNMSDTLDLPERPSCFFLADVNGDGRYDFIVKYNSGGVAAFITYVASSSGSFSAGVYSNISTTDPPFFNN